MAWRRKTGHQLVLGLTVLSALFLGACGSGASSVAPSSNVQDPTAESELGSGLPVGCGLPPFPLEAQRVGPSPIGAADFAVTDAVAIPIPIVPNPDGTVDDTTTAELAASTDLLGYSVVFGDEPLGDNGATFFAYQPSAPGAIRGQVSIYPANPTPFAVGDVVTDGVSSGLSFPLPTIGLDLVAFDDDTNTYLDAPTGQVTILGLTDDAICLDVDLVWTVNQPRDNVLTVRGIITARMLDRSQLVVLG